MAERITRKSVEHEPSIEMPTIGLNFARLTSLAGFRPVIRDFAALGLWTTGLTRPASRLRKSLTIVTFHRVLTDDQIAEYPIPEIAVTCREFEWFLAFFSRYFDCGPLLTMLRRFQSEQEPIRPMLAITFDDGQLDNYTNAVPTLERAGIHATFYPTVIGTEQGCALWPDEAAYAMSALQQDHPASSLDIQAQINCDPARKISPADFVEALKHEKPEARMAILDRMHQHLGSKRIPEWDGMMNSSQLIQLAQQGHEIGSHSYSHPILTLSSKSDLRREVIGSREKLEAMTGIPVESFCYPNGDHNDAIVELVRSAGYAAAVTTKFGRNSASQDAFRLHRCDIQGASSRLSSGNLSAARLALRLSGLQPGL